MVDITLMVPQGVQVIHGYGDGRFRIGEASHVGPVLVRPEFTQSWNVALDVVIAEMDLSSLAPILEAEETYDILLIGTGTRQVFLPPARRAEIRRKGPVVEAMDTGAACRTFNLLLAEGRRVAAALLPVE
jgi:uncharacterized protein